MPLRNSIQTRCLKSVDLVYAFFVKTTTRDFGLIVVRASVGRATTTDFKDCAFGVEVLREIGCRLRQVQTAQLSLLAGT
jgi:hypothetical protein